MYIQIYVHACNRDPHTRSAKMLYGKLSSKHTFANIYPISLPSPATAGARVTDAPDSKYLFFFFVITPFFLDTCASRVYITREIVRMYKTREIVQPTRALCTYIFIQTYTHTK